MRTNQSFMPSASDVEMFLSVFKSKMKIWDVLFLDQRGKNAQALADLELRPIDRIAILEKLDVDDYSEGPLPETFYGGVEMWVFGKMVKKTEVYIKITMGAVGASVICISFHAAEHKMKYPLR
jgi:hypothetical protein